MTAYAYSIWALFHHTHTYFMEAAAIITLISLGHWLESRMNARAAGDAEISLFECGRIIDAVANRWRRWDFSVPSFAPRP